MEIILLQDIARLGSKADIVTVKDGYARNYLVPQKMAVIATESAKKVNAENIRQRAHKEAKLKEAAVQLAEKLQVLKISIGAKTSSSGKIFGSVTNIMLAEAINAQGFEIDRKNITVSEVKEVGSHSAKIKLHKEVIVDLEFEVVAE